MSRARPSAKALSRLVSYRPRRAYHSASLPHNLLPHAIPLSPDSSCASTSAARTFAFARSLATLAPHSASQPQLSNGGADTLQSLEPLFHRDSGISNHTWLSRLQSAIADIDHRLFARSQSSNVPFRTLIAGPKLGRTEELIIAILDEPLREHASVGPSDAQILKDFMHQRRAQETPSSFTIRYGPGPATRISDDAITVDRHWLLEANTELDILIDPSSSESTMDAVYASDFVMLVTDSYALEQCAQRSAASGIQRSGVLDLLSIFSDKPNTHAIVNNITNLPEERLSDALEMAVGYAAAQRLISRDSLVSVSSADALQANEAFRRALLGSQGAESSSMAWSEFSARFTASNVAQLSNRLQSILGRNGSDQALLEAKRFLMQHSVDEALAFCVSARACLEQVSLLVASTQAESDKVVREAVDRVWPPSIAYSGQLNATKLKAWNPAKPGSLGAVKDALTETAHTIESTFERRLQWWKMVWKVDDVRTELEGACSNFARSLETKLAYESGRLATRQAQQVGTAEEAMKEFREITLSLAPLRGATRQAALLSNTAEAFRSREQRALTPQSLIEPIKSRREQLLAPGGPIDELASKAQKLTVTTTAALAATAAGLGSASALGSSLGNVALALEPSTALGLALLVYTAAAWRMQGRFAKIKARFWDDWDRLADGLDHELKNHLNELLRDQVVGQTSFVTSEMTALAEHWRRDITRIEQKVQAASAPLGTRITPSPESVDETPASMQ